MSAGLPQLIAPERLADAGGRVVGELKVRGMTRLAAALDDDSGAIRLELEFARVESGVVRIRGSYEAELLVVCQRCLEPFAMRLSRAIDVGVASDPAALKRLPQGLEPLMLGRETMALADFIEDEILLGLPLAPMHRPEECAAAGQDEEPAVRENPFLALKELNIKRKRE